MPDWPLIACWRWPDALVSPQSKRGYPFGVRLRRTADTGETATELSPANEVEVQESPHKGRPTPKRRDTAPKRQPVSAPRTNKEASQWRKQQVTRAKPNSVTGGPKLTNAELRAARMRGDEDALPRKDRGPSRRFARDWVDTHRMGTNFLLVLIPLYIVAIALPILSAAVFALLLVFIAESAFTAYRIRKALIARSGSTKETTLGLTFYVLGRAYLPRRMRIPKPHLGIGDPID
jgi:hypothetical protein